MKSWHVVVIAALLLLFHSPNAKAADGEGAGVRTCANFLENYKDDPTLTKQLYFAWAQGFMSGLNIARRDDTSGTFESMSMKDQEAHIRSFCEANHNKKYLYAVIDLYTTLYPKHVAK